MENQDKKYEIVINSAINIAKLYSIVSIFITFLIILINYMYNIGKIWNICFLFPLYSLYLASIIQLIICFWKAGKVNSNIEKINSRKSNVIFSSSITFIVFIAVFIVYSILSVIMYS